MLLGQMEQGEVWQEMMLWGGGSREGNVLSSRSWLGDLFKVQSEINMGIKPKV